ncbi:hypothetical protein EG329_007398 [Mollisiaceae sp. DMI_Dod_QoI]|nr:hypothetical protein EG329_007398 [Helotiales sp. DMI_Dod_QoI]
MHSPRRSKGVFLTGLILGLLTLYYFDFFGFLSQDGHKYDLTPPSNEGVVGPERSTSLQSSDTPHSSYTSSTLVNVPQTLSSTQEIVQTPTPTRPTLDQSPRSSVSPEDILLIIKTGANTIWRRMPLHLTTTLSSSRIPHHVIYSDLSERLSTTISSIDILSNISTTIQNYDPSAYAAYLDLQSPSHINTYREHARLPGDEPPDTTVGNQPGWLLDKYKFLPMLTHAAGTWPDKKWYIYIEDDTYIFLDNVLRYLSTLEIDSGTGTGTGEDEPSYYGAYSGEGNATFAQGGSGLVFSHSLMQSIFAGDNIPDLERYGNETSKACCGDIMLGKVLRDYGVFVNKGKYGTSSFRPEPPWKTGFDELVWCAPIFTFHHLHQRDVVLLSELERKKREEDADCPVLFRDVFMELIAPYLQNPQLTHWDNFASRYVMNGNVSDPFHDDLSSVNVTILDASNKSPEACQGACLTVPNCMGWRHDSTKATCGLDTVVKLGREPDPQPHWENKTVVTSGWMLERIDELLLKEKCEVVKDP